MNTKIETLIAEWTQELHTFTHDDPDKYIDLVNRTIAALRQQADQQAQPQARELSDQQIKYMVDRFLGWQLPEYFSPDAGISFNKEGRQYGKAGYWPVGTNLFSADQAREMVRYMAEGIPADRAIRQPQAEGMVLVNKEDANNYCLILTELGMEEEGDPVAEVKRLIAASQKEQGK